MHRAAKDKRTLSIELTELKNPFSDLFLKEGREFRLWCSR